MAVFLGFERARPAVLDGIPEAVQRADARIPAPGKYQLARHAHADHLVVQQVWRQPNQSQIAPFLPDDFVARGERDQMREALDRQCVAILDESIHCFGKGEKFRHQVVQVVVY